MHVILHVVTAIPKNLALVLVKPVISVTLAGLGPIWWLESAWIGVIKVLLQMVRQIKNVRNVMPHAKIVRITENLAIKNDAPSVVLSTKWKLKKQTFAWKNVMDIFSRRHLPFAESALPLAIRVPKYLRTAILAWLIRKTSWLNFGKVSVLLTAQKAPHLLAINVKHARLAVAAHLTLVIHAFLAMTKTHSW